MMYVQDYDETFPEVYRAHNGVENGGDAWPMSCVNNPKGECYGWYTGPKEMPSKISPNVAYLIADTYCKNGQIFACPSGSRGWWCPATSRDNVSYGYTNNLADGWIAWGGPAPTLSFVKKPSETVMWFEIGKAAYAMELNGWDDNLPGPWSDWTANHNEMRNILWVDGHVKTVKDDMVRKRTHQWYWDCRQQ